MRTSGWCMLPSRTRTAQAVQQPMRQAQGSSSPCSSASHSTYLSSGTCAWTLFFLSHLLPVCITENDLSHFASSRQAVPSLLQKCASTSLEHHGNKMTGPELQPIMPSWQHQLSFGSLAIPFNMQLSPCIGPHASFLASPGLDDRS